MLKKILRHPWVVSLLSGLIGGYLRLVYRTTRWRFEGFEHFEAAAAQEKGVILAFWHGRLMMGASVRKQTDRRAFMLISAGQDGEIIARAIEPFGIECIRGSAANPKKRKKNKNGIPAATIMVERLNDGHIIGVTPDGPRGPRHKVGPGTLRLAALSGAPIVPAAYATSRAKVFSSWDRFMFAFPFGRGAYVAGPAIAAPQDSSAAALDETRADLEAALQRVTDTADTMVGRAPNVAQTQLGATPSAEEQPK